MLGEGTLGVFVFGYEDVLVKDDHLQIAENIACLCSFSADKLKYVHNKAFGYNKCKVSSTLNEALMIKIMNGETQYDC